MEINRILDQWLIQVTDIAGEDYFLFFVIFLNDDLNARRSKEMSGIYETYADSLGRFDGFSYGHGTKFWITPMASSMV